MLDFILSIYCLLEEDGERGIRPLNFKKTVWDWRRERLFFFLDKMTLLFHIHKFLDTCVQVVWWGWLVCYIEDDECCVVFFDLGISWLQSIFLFELQEEKWHWAINSLNPPPVPEHRPRASESSLPWSWYEQHILQHLPILPVLILPSLFLHVMLNPCSVVPFSPFTNMSLHFYLFHSNLNSAVATLSRAKLMWTNRVEPYPSHLTERRYDSPLSWRFMS